MELRHFRYFIAIAEHLSFSAAARRLHMSQPPLSLAVREMEEELGVRLFERSRRHVRLTPAGTVFLREARRTVEQAERAARLAASAGAAWAGSLQIGYTPSADLTVLPAFVCEARARAPGVEIGLRALSTAQQTAALREGTLDAGFVRLPLEGASTPFLEARRLFSEPLVAALAARHPLARRRRIPFRRLANEPLILFPRAMDPQTHDDLLARARRDEFCLTIGWEAETLQTALGLAAEGLGIALVPLAAACLAREGVALRRLDAPEPSLTMGLAVRRPLDAEPAALIARAADAALARLRTARRRHRGALTL